MAERSLLWEGRGWDSDSGWQQARNSCDVAGDHQDSTRAESPLLQGWRIAVTQEPRSF